MAYCFNRQASFASYSPYQLLYGWEPILFNSIHEKYATIIDLNDSNVLAQCLHEQAKFFK
uniref:Uncharacterized protein n=2 Tax=Physcomitrium patens TaxID=3218 RepID=A0A7I3ZAZ5_PHYPA